MKIKQFGKKYISNNEILNIIKLMKLQDENFKYHTVSKITIWNSKILWFLNRFFTLDILTTSSKDILKNNVKGEYNNSNQQIEIFSFVLFYQHKNKNHNKLHLSSLLKLEVIYNLLHEFRHNYQSIFLQEQYNENVKTYSQTVWADNWVEKDACNFTKKFMDHNHYKIDDCCNININWNVKIDTDIEKEP